jgi:TetR/AcrR family transcriptional repressor of nem operon
MATKGERTRDHILGEASRLILRKGIGTTSVGEILSAAGVHKGSLYFHFRDKEEIGCEVIRQAADRFIGFIDRSLTGATPGKALDNFYSAALAYHQGAGFVGGCLFGNTALETSDAEPRLAALVDEVFVTWIDRIRRVIADGQRSGEFRNDVPARDLAQQVVATLEGGIMLSRLRKDPAPLETCIRNLRVFLRPLGPMQGGPARRRQGGEDAPHRPARSTTRKR